MKIYELRPTAEGLPKFWEPWYDKCFGFTIVAESEEEARKLASEASGDEYKDWDNQEINPWLEPKYSTCEEIKVDKSRIVTRDFCSA